MSTAARNPRRPVVVIGGPTASGKSGLALDLARQFDGDIVNADAMQVYRELAILTARPAPRDLAAAPHRLYGVLPAAERCSAGRWHEMARATIAGIHETGRLPILVGGSGLYLRALMQGLADVPTVPETIRVAVGARMAALGPQAMHALLNERDPETAARLAPADRQRVRRALEVLEATGRSLSDWQREAQSGAPEFDFLAIVVEPPRDALREACDARFRAMLEAGALDEVRAVTALGLPSDRPALKALGLRELARHLAGESDLETAVAEAQAATRRYAKRQSTWFRNQLPDAKRLPAGPGYAQYSERIFQDICTNIRHFLLTRQT
ncbi:MAG: tRNA (adenosine(37)-N6)-dimethylallyltransferase MiaA [Dongiaceae bacterium]